MTQCSQLTESKLRAKKGFERDEHVSVQGVAKYPLDLTGGSTGTLTSASPNLLTAQVKCPFNCHFTTN